MDKRLRLGLKYFFDNKSNSGIVNYIYNIIAALKTLDDDEKPAIIVFYSDNAPIDYLKTIEYPYIQYILFKPWHANFFIRKLNGAFKKIFKTDVYKRVKYFNKIDCLYPYFEFIDSEFKEVKNKIHWLVDFNNRAFPSHYADGGKSMTEFQERLTGKEDHLVLSSNSLLDEMKTYYPKYKNKVSVLPFACTLPSLENVDFGQLKKKYGLNEPYFMSPNQFWEHKNQLLLIEAINLLKTSGPLDFQVIFTGSMDVNRGKGNILGGLLDSVNQYKLKDKVKFLGIIDRQEQLVLMKNARALIQPSLYEGWSTLVEEAKALNQKIILSDLAVHHEQACKNSYFFNPASVSELAKQIQVVNENNSEAHKINYADNILHFGKDIMAILKYEINKK